jgi:glucose/arabinose dehydrogenase
MEALEDRFAPATLPPGFSESMVASGLSSATAMELSPDGKLFVTEQAGTMEIWQGGSRLQANFFRDAPLTVNSSGERGLLGVTFDPNYATNRHVYVYYTATSPVVHNRLSRFTANAAGDLALAGSETIILELDNLSSATNHNGGAIHFGKDGKLYVAVGDNANGANAQSFATLHGKMLRLNADGTIPADNPYLGRTTGKYQSIWAMGLRNPFTFAVQPGTGRIFINDVGQSAWEEINDGAPGANYNWPATEGNFTPPTPNPDNLTPPFYAYPNDASTCAITGGVFYNPTTVTFPTEYVNDYFFADFCGNWIKRIDLTTKAVVTFATSVSAPVDLKVANDGALFYLARGTGQIWRVQSTDTEAPQFTQHPQDKTVSVGQSATFTVAATGTAPLNYQWQRDNGSGFNNIVGANSSSYTLTAALADNGARFRAVVTNAFGSATSNAATLTVVSNLPPTATITDPAAGTLYSAGETIFYAGTGTDPEDGALPDTAFTWQVDFHHDDHVHPFIPPTSGSKNGSFVIPTTGETSANVWYRIHLTVKDSGNLTDSKFVDVSPRTSTVTLNTGPSGLQILLDDQPKTTPHSFVGVVNFTRTIEAPATQVIGGATWTFVSWSDGGARRHDISTPPINSTYTATYELTALKLNFQPASAVIPAGYTADAGSLYGSRGGGLTFGWNGNNTSNTRDRNSARSPDQRYDTLIHMQKSPVPNARWEVAVPNGAYSVRLVAGDATQINSTYRINVEGVLAINGKPTSSNRWIEGNVTVTVSDGRLTVSNATGAKNNKLNFLELTRVEGVSGQSAEEQNPPTGRRDNHDDAFWSWFYAKHPKRRR